MESLIQHFNRLVRGFKGIDMIINSESVNGYERSTYKIKEVVDRDTATEWIIDALRKIEKVSKYRYGVLANDTKGYIGNDKKGFNAFDFDLTTKNITERDKEITLVCLHGKYKGVFVAIKLDFNTFEVSITIAEDNLDKLGEIENTLSLVE